MTKNLFNAIDLNLLRIFLVLFQERNMRKAADRLFVTQPAISQSLKKLRHHFNDDLFIKAPFGLEVTAEAERIAANIIPHLDGLYGALNSLEAFDPATIKRKIQIAFAPQVLISMSGCFFLELKTKAPHLDVEFVQWTSNTFEDIENSSLLLGLSYDYPNVSKQIKQIEVAKITGCCAVRKGHPLKGLSASAESFSQYEIASLFIPGWSEDLPFAAKKLKERSLPFSVGFRSAFPMAIADVIQKTDMFYPTSNLFPFADYPNIRRIDVEDTDIQKQYSLFSYFHQRNKNDPLTAWLNTILAAQLESAIQ
ncbi:LysR family transcriptional regulator [Enterovibrio calviensis]|uniref:LysR family transcriptional regulator n=1 Tax=Enterovibrio calviensis TaxID=91359 RepID=UPI00373539D0